MDKLGAAEGARPFGVTVHDRVSHGEEVVPLKGLSKEVCEVINRVDIGHRELTVLDTFPNEEVTTLDMLDAVVMFGVVGEVNGGLVVAPEFNRFVLVLETQLGKHAVQCHSLFGGFRCYHYR